MADMDFMSYADKTERMKTICDTIRLVLSIPEQIIDNGSLVSAGISAGQKTAALVTLTNMLTDCKDAPTKQTTAKQLDEVERALNQIRSLETEFRALVKIQELKNNGGGYTNIPETGSQNTTP